MASPGAAMLSFQPSPRDPARKIPLAGLLVLVAAFACFLFATMEDSTAPAIAPRHMVAAGSVVAHPKTDPHRRGYDPPSAAERGPVPPVSALNRMVYGLWQTRESLVGTGRRPDFGGTTARWDLRQELVDMAAAQRRHWTPRNAFTGRDNSNSDDRIAHALFISRQNSLKPPNRPSRFR
jgi:hypothetical protein